MPPFSQNRLKVFLAPGRLRSWASAIPMALSNFTNNGPLIQGPFCGADRRVRRGGGGVGPDDDDLSAMTSSGNLLHSAAGASQTSSTSRGWF